MVEQAHQFDDSPAAVLGRWANYRATPLIDVPLLAQQGGVAQVLVKDEGQRPLRSFKALGGMYAGLRALSRAVGVSSVGEMFAAGAAKRALPPLFCASDGNHGLAVAAAAQLAGANARVYVHRHVSLARADRIAARGAEVIWVDGTYDDSVDRALQAAQRGEGLLIADTSGDAHDPVVADVMAGYSLIADEVAAELRAGGAEMPTHLFVQAGVGGLAAALARGLRESHGIDCRVVVVEPEAVACVGLALRVGHVERMGGELTTAAEMLSCGEASTPAVRILQRHEAVAVAVAEPQLIEAVRLLAACGGPQTTPSGATGVAGLLAAAGDRPLAQQLGLNESSRVLLIATEATMPERQTRGGER
jgi:diaminopropionate ammonia-lyase